MYSMKKHPLLLFTLFLVFLLPVSCSDEDCDCYDGGLVAKWEATTFMSVESMMYSKDDDYNPTIEFKGDGTMEIHLDINMCGGDYQIGLDSTINMGNTGCTEACCDSQFSQKFVEMLPRVDSYEIENTRLRLLVSGWGWINLERLSD